MNSKTIKNEFLKGFLLFVDIIYTKYFIEKYKESKSYVI